MSNKVLRKVGNVGVFTDCVLMWSTLLKLVPNCAGTGLASSKRGTETFKIVLSRPLSAAFRELQKTDNGP